MEWLEWIKNIIANDWIQKIATFLGGVDVVISFLFFLLSYLLYKKIYQKNTPPAEDTIETKHKWFSRFSHRYNERIIFEHRVFNVRGLRTQGTFTLKLENVFVELRIAHAHNPQQARVNPILAKEFADNHPIWDFLRFNKKRHQDDTLVFAILGAPGCGKTTLLQHIALAFANKQQRRYGLPAYVPLLLFLRQHVETIVTTAPNLADLAQAHFSETNKYPNLHPPAGWFAQRLATGKCLILLDGLDEVANLQQRQQVSDWVDQQIINYPRCHFLITSRPQGYLTAPIEQANVLEVQPFNAAQVRRFVHAWYLANEVISFGSEDEGVRHKAKQEADDLLQRLRAMPTLTALTVNPLLLTMIAMVHRYRGQLPGRRVELYAEICDVLLGHWQQSKKHIKEPLTAAQKRVALQPLAAQMMKRQLRDISTDEAMLIIKNPLKRVGLKGEAADNFLRDVQASSGLLLESEVGVWRFAHLTFQEYLAAAHFLDQKTKLTWPEIVNDSWWHETLRLYAAQGNATPLVQACLDNNTVATLTLVTDLLEEALELDESVRHQIEERLINDLESDDSQRRQLAAEVRLNRRLNSLQRIDEHREIDLEYITCAEYQLFLDEKRAQDEYYQPDHWTEYTFPKGTAQEPIRGVRPKDAKAFCEWLTHRQGGEIYYRLPQSAEIMDYPPVTNVEYLATWYQENEIYSFHGLTKAEESQIRFWSKTISDLPFDFYFALARDLALARALDLARDLALARALARDLALNLARALGLARAHDLARARALDLDLDLVRDLALTCARALARALAGALALDHDLVKAIKQRDFQTAKQFAQNMQSESDIIRQRIGTLLYELLVCATATTPLEARQAWRKYTATIAEYVWIGFHEIEKEQKRPWWQRWLYRQQSNYQEDKRVILNLYWWLQMVMAREQGQLPAWEGIRIVREPFTV